MRILRSENLAQKTFRFVKTKPKDVFLLSIMIILLAGFITTMIQLQKQQEIRQHASTTNCPVNYYSLDSEESNLLVLINQYRQSRGLGSLTASSHLNRAAQFKVEDMIKQPAGTMTHSDTTGRPYSQMIWDCGYPTSYGVGENLYYTNSNNSTADRALKTWQRSPSHDENLLFPAFKQIGIARINAAAGWYWSNEFGEGLDGTDGSFIGPPTAPRVTSFNPSCRGADNVMTISFTPGSGATYNQLIYSPSCYTCAQQIITVIPGQVIPSSGGFSANTDIYYNVQSCNSIGCTQDPNGNFIKNTGTSCLNDGSTPTITPTPTTSPTTTVCNFTASNNLSIIAGTNKAISVSALNLNSGTTDLGFTSGTDKLFKNVGNTAVFNSTMSLTAPISSYTAATGANYTFSMNLTTTTLTPLGQYTLDAIYLYLNGIKTQCTYNGVGGLAINVTVASGGGGGGSSTPTPTKTPTPTPTPTNGPTPTVSKLPTPTSTNVLTPTPYIISCGVTSCNGSTQVCLSDYYTGASTCCAKGYTYVCNGTCSTTPCPTPTPSNCSACSPDFARQCVSSSQIRICMSGCWQTMNCASSEPICTNGNCMAPTPTPTTFVSSCPSYDSTTGYNNICTTNPCIGGSSLYKNGAGNQACSSYYGSYYGTCCMVTNLNGCPADGYNVCRQSGCFAGETNVSVGNAVCAFANGWNTGYCCR